MKQDFLRKPTTRVLVFLSVLSIVILLTVVAIVQSRSNAVPITPIHILGPTPSPNISFDPATYSLPSIIAGYQVLGVQTLENTACMRPNARRLILLAPEPDEESFLSNTNVDDVLQELEDLNAGAEVEWELSFVSPGTTLEQIRSGLEEWNAQFGNGNCVRLGPEATPTP